MCNCALIVVQPHNPLQDRIEDLHFHLPPPDSFFIFHLITAEKDTYVAENFPIKIVVATRIVVMPSWEDAIYMADLQVVWVHACMGSPMVYVAEYCTLLANILSNGRFLTVRGRWGLVVDILPNTDRSATVTL